MAAAGASDASLILFDAEGKLATNLAFSDFKMQKRSSTVMETITKGRNNQMPAFKDLLGEGKAHLLAAYVWGLSNKAGK